MATARRAPGQVGAGGPGSITTAPPGGGGQTSLLDGIHSRIYWTGKGMVEQFNPHRRVPIDLDPSIHGPAYVFVSRPDLNIGVDGEDRGNVDSYLGTGTPIAPNILRKQLSGNGFIPLLTNTCLTFPHQDVTLDTIDLWENWSANRMTLPKDTVSSRQGGQVALEFQEFTGAPVSLLIRLWVEYIDGVTKGRFYPKDRYLNDRILDYCCCIYVFLLEPDGFTIEWGSKYTGCFPASIPGSAFTSSTIPGEGVKVSVPFTYSYYETMDPSIIGDFNASQGSSPDREAAPDLGLAASRSPTPVGSDFVRIDRRSGEGGKSKYILVFPTFQGNTSIQRVGI